MGLGTQTATGTHGSEGPLARAHQSRTSRQRGRTRVSHGVLPCAVLVRKVEPTWGGPGTACLCVGGGVLVWRGEGVGGGLSLDEAQVLGVQQRQRQHTHQARVADEREDLQAHAGKKRKPSGQCQAPSYSEKGRAGQRQARHSLFDAPLFSSDLSGEA